VKPSALALSLSLSLAVSVAGCNVAARAGSLQHTHEGLSSAPGPDIRPEVGGMNGAIVSDHPLASLAGYEVLRAGGNAIDAAVTAAAALTVVRPHMNSVGGDAFFLFY
jgi:gamma-glutamyltranspeptidase